MKMWTSVPNIAKKIELVFWREEVEQQLKFLRMAIGGCQKLLANLKKPHLLLSSVCYSF